MRYTAAHWGSYEINGEKLQPIASDPAPSRIGRGWVSAVRDRHSRILKPALRVGWLNGDEGAGRPADSFIEVEWNKAICLAASELARVRASYGNGAIFGGSYGWASAGRFHHAQSQLHRFMKLAGGYVDARDTYSHAAAEVLWPLVIGMTNREFQDGMTRWPLIVRHCTLLVAFGGISTRTAQIASSGTSEHDVTRWLKNLGARVVNISPQTSGLEREEWWAIRPGTDTALMLGLSHVLHDEGLQNDYFLARYTSGWREFHSYLTGEYDGQAKTADWAAPICDIPAWKIRQLARDMAANRTMISLSWGIQRADHGEQPLWAGLALAAMLGQIGRPGTGFGFGYGSTTAVGRPARLYPWPALPQGSNPVSDFIPVARITEMLERPNQPYTYNLSSRMYPDIRMIWWVGGNPFHHQQDLNRLDRAWCRPETVIVQDHSWTATARRADIVMPATTPLERDDIMMNRRDPVLLYMSQMFAPMGQSLDDYEIFRRLAVELGFEHAFTEGRCPEQWLRHLWKEATEVAASQGVQLPAFNQFRELGRFDMPDNSELRVQFSDFVADPDAHPLATESGRIMLSHQAIAAASLPDCPGHPAWLQPEESLLDAPEGALHLISGQPDTRLHSQNDRGQEALADKINGCEPCYLHPDTAASRNIEEEQIVQIWNSRGATLAGAKFSTGIRRDCIALATGAWFNPVDGLDHSGNPNVLTLDKGCSGLSQGNSAHTALVFVKSWTGPLPSLTVCQSPPFCLQSCNPADPEKDSVSTSMSAQLSLGNR